MPVGYTNTQQRAIIYHIIPCNTALIKMPAALKELDTVHYYYCASAAY